jgi:hypothetical protein
MIQRVNYLGKCEKYILNNVFIYDIIALTYAEKPNGFKTDILRRNADEKKKH